MGLGERGCGRSGWRENCDQDGIYKSIFLKKHAHGDIESHLLSHKVPYTPFLVPTFPATTLSACGQVGHLLFVTTVYI